MTLALADHTPTRCAHCAVTDDHPKHHYGSYGTWHHSCAPVDVQQATIAGLHVVHPLIYAKTLKADQDGMRGQELRDYIASLAMQDFGDLTMLMYTTLADDVLNQIFNGGASGSVVIGTTTYTLPFKVRWLSTVSVAGTAGTQWSGGSYAPVSLSGNFTTPASAQAIASTAAVTVTNAPATTWADNDIEDSTGTPKLLVFKGTPSLALTVNSGDTATIPISDLTGAQT